MIACKTLISKGAGPKEGDRHSHGYALFDEEIAAARQAMGWPHEPFVIPDGVEYGPVPSVRNCSSAAARVVSLTAMELVDAVCCTKAMMLKTQWSFMLGQISSGAVMGWAGN